MAARSSATGTSNTNPYFAPNQQQPPLAVPIYLPKIVFDELEKAKALEKEMRAREVQRWSEASEQIAGLGVLDAEQMAEVRQLGDKFNGPDGAKFVQEFVAKVIAKQLQNSLPNARQMEELDASLKTLSGAIDQNVAKEQKLQESKDKFNRLFEIAKKQEALEQRVKTISESISHCSNQEELEKYQKERAAAVAELDKLYEEFKRLKPPSK